MDGEPSEQKEFLLPDGAIVNPDGTVHYTLRCPIAYSQGGVDSRIEHVTVRRKNMGDNKAIKSMTNGIDVAATLIARLTGLDMVNVDKLDDIDAEAIGDIIEGFTKPGPLMPNSAPG